MVVINACPMCSAPLHWGAAWGWSRRALVGWIVARPKDAVLQPEIIPPRLDLFRLVGFGISAPVIAARSSTGPSRAHRRAPVASLPTRRPGRWPVIPR